jgi:sporulation protein YqfC
MIQNKRKLKLGERLSELLEIPKDTLFNMPRFTLIGDREVTIENYLGILEYTAAITRVKTGIGEVIVSGEGLIVKEITAYVIEVSGIINAVNFKR